MMLLLAALSPDARVRDAALRWQHLTCAEQQDTTLERVCCGAGIDGGDFIGAVAVTAWELGIDVGVLIGGIGYPPDRSYYRALVRDAERELSNAPQPPCQFSLFRDRLGLSQAQFANLFLTTARTVRRWENGESAPTKQQQWLCCLLSRCATRNGIRKFLQRFVAVAPNSSTNGPEWSSTSS